MTGYNSEQVSYYVVTYFSLLASKALIVSFATSFLNSSHFVLTLATMFEELTPFPLIKDNKSQKLPFCQGFGGICFMGALIIDFSFKLATYEVCPVCPLVYNMNASLVIYCLYSVKFLSFILHIEYDQFPKFQ